MHLDDQVWARLRGLPDPRSPQGRIYTLASLVAVALCGLTCAGHDRLTGIGQWIKRAGPEEHARLGLPWNPMTGQYRVPDEKTIRTALAGRSISGSRMFVVVIGLRAAGGAG
jgi:hypothetical protein